MYKYRTDDAGILFTGLSNYRNLLEKDLEIEGLPVIIIEEFERTIKRINEILEEI